MMSLYYVKRDLFGVQAGRVERFAPHKAGAFLAEGFIEPYDEKKHGSKPGAPPYESKRAKERQEAEALEAQEAVQTSAAARGPARR